ncbi:MAG: hypothetical protein JXB38_08860, partial [Anaerolineales bacterium]|nr:hypothetical protein [Anaerolineales bacterium]
MPSNPLVEAITLLKAGDRAGARNLIIPVIKANRENEKAWLILVETLDSTEEKIATLNRFLQIKPGSELAQRRLQALHPAASPPQPTSTPPAPQPEPPTAPSPAPTLAAEPAEPVETTPPPTPDLDTESTISDMRAEAEFSAPDTEAEETFEWGAVAEDESQADDFGDLRAAADAPPLPELEEDPEESFDW